MAALRVERASMKKCIACGSSRLSPAKTWETREFGGVTFGAHVAGQRCETCGETYAGQYALEMFDLEVAADLARAGQRDGAAFRFQRKALGYSAAQFAELLSVAPETVSRWETHKVEVPVAVAVTLGALVNDQLHGRTDTRDQLRGLREPCPQGTIRKLRDITTVVPPAS